MSLPKCVLAFGTNRSLRIVWHNAAKNVRSQRVSVVSSLPVYVFRKDDSQFVAIRRPSRIGFFDKVGECYESCKSMIGSMEFGMSREQIPSVEFPLHPEILNNVCRTQPLDFLQQLFRVSGNLTQFFQCKAPQTFFAAEALSSSSLRLIIERMQRNCLFRMRYRLSVLS